MEHKKLLIRLQRITGIDGGSISPKGSDEEDVGGEDGLDGA
jgi:hypothetical protein